MRTSWVVIVGLLVSMAPALGATAGEVWLLERVELDADHPRPAEAGVVPLPTDEPLLVEPVRFAVGMHGVPRGMERGDVYHGALVVSVNKVLHFIAVETYQPDAFQTSTLADPNVRYVEPDPVLPLLRYVPNDPRWNDQYGPEQVRADEVWDDTFGTAGSAAVCVVDTGVRSAHEDLTGSRWKGGRDVINNDNDPADDNGHGTHVTGTAVAGTDNAKGIAGVAEVDFYHAKGLNAQGSGTWTQVADAIEWCSDNAPTQTVISMSLGGAGGAGALQDAVDYAYGRGNLLIAAAGNGGPCNNCVDYPGAYDNVMAITCTTSTEAQCGFSSDGPQSELAAPGNSVLSTCYTSNTAYCTKSGTSMSTPHAAGVAALVWSQDTAISNANLRQAMRDTAKDLGSAGWDEQFGYGLVDAKALYDDLIGGGGTPPPEESQVSFESFDDGAADGWTLGGLWHVGSACATAPSSPNYLAYNEDSDCQYSTGGATSGTATFTVDLTGATVGTLKFQHRWETESYAGGAYDIMRVQVSTDGGSSWTTLKQWDSRDSNQLAFGAFSLDLDAYTGGSTDVRFQFDSVDGVSNNFEGWFLDDVEVTADVDGGPPPNQAPVANAGPDQTAGDDDGSGAETVTLDGTGSSDSDGTIVSYTWKEGATTLGTGATLDTSLGVGTHTITLEVEDDDGATDTDTVVVTVNANQAPTASFTYDCTDLSCTFDGGGSSDPDGTISAYSWDFGDGNAGSGSSTSHTYAEGGTYSVTLTVTDNGGATDGETKSVQVTEPGGEVLVFGEDFEAGADGWHKSGGATDLWRRASGCFGGAGGSSWSIQFNNANNDCDYNTGAQSTGWARSPTIDLSGRTSATLRFNHAWETESYAGAAYDKMLVEVSSDDGASWTTLKQWDSRDANSVNFRAEEFDVSAHISSTFRVRYQFDSVDGVSNNFDGWAVDDVEVWAQ